MLTQFLALDVYRFLVVFARLGAALMFLPGFGATMVPTRMRLLFGLSVAFLLLPVLGPKLPPIPTQPAQLAALLAGEAAVGLFLAMICQFLFAAVDIAGTFISYQIGLTNAFSFDAVSQEQSQTLTGLLSNFAMVAVFAADGHHLMLQALNDSYDMFQPGVVPLFGDMAMTMAHLLSSAFSLGVRLAAPVMVFGIVFQVGLGLLSRMVPQMQVFFVATPVQVLVGLWMIMVALPVIWMIFLQAFTEGLGPYLAPG